MTWLAWLDVYIVYAFLTSVIGHVSLHQLLIMHAYCYSCSFISTFMLMTQFWYSMYLVIFIDSFFTLMLDYFSLHRFLVYAFICIGELALTPWIYLQAFIHVLVWSHARIRMRTSQRHRLRVFIMSIVLYPASAFLHSGLLSFTSCDITCVFLDRTVIVQQYLLIC
jgi:hypothetical protein